MIRNLLLLLAVLPACFGAADIPNVALIDKQGDNFFFRGGDAVINGVFQYDFLVSKMNAASTLPPQFYVIILNLLGAVDTDQASIATERAYWANPNNTGKGETILMPIYGANRPPTDFDAGTVEYMARALTEWMDDVPSVLNVIRNILLTPRDIPVVLFAHCTCGCDRTGEISEAYYMTYQNVKTFTRARNTNVQLIGREQVLQNLWGGWWYCYYLKYTLSYDVSCVFPDPEAIVLPKCEVSGTQSLVSTSNADGVVSTAWQVDVTSTDPTNDITGIRWYYSGSKRPTTVTSDLVSISGNQVYGYTPTLHPLAHLQWGYTSAYTSALTLLIIAPAVCLGNPVPLRCPANYFGAACDTPCGVDFVQTASGSWTGASQWNVKLNIGSSSLYDVQVEVDSHGASFSPFGGQFIPVLGKPNVYRIGKYMYSNTAGTLSNSANFGYTIGSSSPASFRLYNNACTPPPCSRIAISSRVTGISNSATTKTQWIELSLTNKNFEGSVANAAIRVDLRNGARISGGSNIAPTSSAAGATSQIVTCTAWNLPRGSTSTGCSVVLSTPIATAQESNADFSLSQGICVL